jgi:hypothetical protein
MGSKKTLAYLHDPKLQEQAGITPDERGAIRACVPFGFQPSKNTGVIYKDTSYSAEDFLRKYREYFVLKPATGTHGGKGVYFGANADNWDEAIRLALDTGNYLAQHYVPYESATTTVTSMTPDGDLTTVDFVQDTNLHLVNGSASGTTICRLAPKSHGPLTVMNISSGGGLRPSYNV